MTRFAITIVLVACAGTPEPAPARPHAGPQTLQTDCAKITPGFELVEQAAGEPYAVQLVLYGIDNISCATCMLRVRVGDQNGEESRFGLCTGSAFLRQRPRTRDKIMVSTRASNSLVEFATVR